MPQEYLFSNLGACFAPAQNISPIGRRGQWRSVSYRAGDISGTMLSCLGGGDAPDVTFDPQLTGWYKIYVCLPTFTGLETQLKLTCDSDVWRLTPLHGSGLAPTRVEESFWRYAKMDGQQVTLSRTHITPILGVPSALAWLRFVAMTEEEVAALLARRADPTHRNLYATDDIHNQLFYGGIMDSNRRWNIVTQPFEDTDVEWLSLEEITLFVSGQCATEDPTDFNFHRAGDLYLQQQRDNFNSLEVLSHLVAEGHAKDLKMSLSLRMGAWGIGYPFDQCYFDFPDYLANPQWRCVMRDGVPAAAWSYAYDEVQQYMLRALVNLAKCGCDAVTLIAHRGIPYVLYEPPVAEAFRAAYGEDPFDLPLDEPRLNALHCDIMTGFFRKLRAALDEACPDRHVQVHLRSLYTVYDNKYVGLDCETLAAEGLVDAFINYPSRYREVLSPACFKPDGRIDLEAYSRHVYDPDLYPYVHDGGDTAIPNSRGEAVGYVDLKTMVDEWMDLERRYGTKIYIDIMPRVMEPGELRRRALELYDCGAQRLALWDTYGRIPCKAMWATARDLGHREALAAPFTKPYRLFFLKELAGNDVSRYLPIWGG